MKYFIHLICLSFPSIVFCQQKNDSTAIINLLKNDYSTMLSMDLKKHISNCTEDYLLIEGGDIWNMEKESKWYKDDANKVTDRKDNFDFKYIRIDGNVAYAVYNLKSDISKEGKITQKNWNESTVFRKVNGEWKIALIHSTPIK
jgi:ketosteroid isomerase-like protein